MRRLSLLLTLLPTVFTASARADSFDDAMKIIGDPQALVKREPEAMRLLSAVDRSHKYAREAAYNLGLLLNHNGDVPGARAAWQKALSIDAKHAGSRAQLAGLDLWNPSTSAAAVATLEEIIKEDRFQPDARNLLSSWDIARGTKLLPATDKTSKAEAQKAFDSAIRHGRNVLLGDPENTHAFLNVAIAYMRQGLYDQAGLIALNAIEKQPRAAALHNVMGLVYLSQDNSRSATESFLAALSADPQNDDARLNLAALELAYGNFESALKRFDEVLMHRGSDASVLMSRAVALRGVGRYDEAEKGYLAAQALDKTNIEVDYNLCVLHQQYTQKYDLAKQWCEAYLGRIDKTHSKHAEVARRVKSVDATLKALNKLP
jgi:tetratricopeptide (TPR) repeat protein